MKKLPLWFLKIYKDFLSHILHQLVGAPHACRYSPTCSEYATIHVEKDGIIIGGLKSFARVALCNPFVNNLPQFLKS